MAAPNEIQFNRMNLNLMVPADCEPASAPCASLTRQNGESRMTKMKTPGAVMILCASIATPAFAQDVDVFGPGSRYGVESQPGAAHLGRARDRGNFRGAYNQSNAPLHAAPRTEAGWNMKNFGFGGRDPSRVGGEDPSLRPSGS
jgi:hypothetical protein